MLSGGFVTPSLFNINCLYISGVCIVLRRMFLQCCGISPVLPPQWMFFHLKTGQEGYRESVERQVCVLRPVLDPCLRCPKGKSFYYFHSGGAERWLLWERVALPWCHKPGWPFEVAPWRFVLKGIPPKRTSCGGWRRELWEMCSHVITPGQL